mmetsp:Transcript_156730/g.503052  ORF Transcript_156730/g.503052 Transcript_156730/m.503052 type:complete len:249 (+) Transcript_156730:480-1226(+)
MVIKSHLSRNMLLSGLRTSLWILQCLTWSMPLDTPARAICTSRQASSDQERRERHGSSCHELRTPCPPKELAEDPTGPSLASSEHIPGLVGDSTEWVEEDRPERRQRSLKACRSRSSARKSMPHCGRAPETADPSAPRRSSSLWIPTKRCGVRAVHTEHTESDSACSPGVLSPCEPAARRASPSSALRRAFSALTLLCSADSRSRSSLKDGANEEGGDGLGIACTGGLWGPPHRQCSGRDSMGGGTSP